MRTYSGIIETGRQTFRALHADCVQPDRAREDSLPPYVATVGDRQWKRHSDEELVM